MITKKQTNDDPLIVYCNMWRDLESFLRDAVRDNDPDYAEQANEFLKLMKSVKRKYTDV